ncbi:hypothetical protein [Haloarcula salina]|uniref:Lipoprotein n=1 Tax=Haloarcula salina TaxID=1429914 RepID=A0AA41G7N6_9EURY|nr:hypothetical protein [Haloarcula salina]MBV0901657.1 hypothetical protein [Haloarcula salina]
MNDLSRRGFGVALLAAFSAGCLGTRSRQESDTTPVPEATASQSPATPERAEVSTPADSPPAAADTATPQPSASAPADGTTDSPARIQVETETPEPKTDRRSMEATFRLEEDTYQDYGVESTEQFALTYDMIVRRGPPVDVLLFTEEEYQAFQREYRARHLVEVSKFHETNIAENRVTVSPGAYRLVVNNTAWSRAIPSPDEPYDAVEGECIVDFSFSTELAGTESG